MYKIFGQPYTRTYRVLWALEEMELPYELVTAAPQSDEVRAVNLSGKVPVLQVGDEVITDSTAILTLLADKHGQLTAPAGTLARGQQDAMTQMILDEVDSVLWTAARHTFILPEDWRRPQVKDSLRWEFTRTLDRLASQLNTPFLMGEEITLPDIIFTHCLNWAHSAKFPVEQETLIAYGARLRGRAAYKRVAARVK